MSFFRKVGRTIGRGLSTVGKVGKSILGGVEAVAKGVTKVPIVGGVIKELYEETPLKAIGDVARRVGKDVFTISEGLGTALQEQNVKGVIKGGKQALGLARDVRRQAPQVRQNVGQVVPALRQRMQQQIKPMPTGRSPYLNIGQMKGEEEQVAM